MTVGNLDRKCVLMVIAEAISDEQMKEFVRLTEEWFGEIMLEDRTVLGEYGGRMVVVQAIFTTRERMIQFKGSREYRTWVVRTQHLLIGNVVVKVFEVHTDTLHRLLLHDACQELSQYHSTYYGDEGIRGCQGGCPALEILGRAEKAGVYEPQTAGGKAVKS